VRFSAPGTPAPPHPPPRHPLLGRVDPSGTFFYHRPSYDDETWIPQTLEYGVLVEGKEWWVDSFRNK